MYHFKMPYFNNISMAIYRVILSVLDPRKCEYLKDCSLDFEQAYITTNTTIGDVVIRTWEVKVVACRKLVFQLS